MKELVLLDTELRSLDIIISELAEMSDALEKLTIVSEVIEKYGMTKEVMLAADPRGELVQMGIVGSYELLDTRSTSEVEEATEAIGDTIRKLVGSVTKRLGKAKDRITGIFDSFKNMAADLPVQLEKYKETINSITLDNAKLAEKEIRSIPFDDLELLKGTVKNLTDRKIFSEIEKVVKHMVERARSGSRVGVVSRVGNMRDLITGNKYISEYKGKVDLLSKEISDRYQRDTLNNLGYRNKNNVIRAIDTTLSTLDDVSDIDKYVSEFYKNQEQAIRGIQGLTRIFVKSNAVTDISALYIEHGHAISKLLRALKKVLRGTLTMSRAVAASKVTEETS